MKTLKELAVDHPYYCSDSNYYSRDPSGKWQTFNDFYEEYKDADIDYNLIFRWDIKLYDKIEPKKSTDTVTIIYTEQELADMAKDRYYCEVFMIHQRKGIFAPHHIESITEDDVPKFIEIMTAHFERLKEMWEPIFLMDNLTP